MLQALSQFANKIQRAETGSFSFVFEGFQFHECLVLNFIQAGLCNVVTCIHMRTHISVLTYTQLHTFIALGKGGGGGNCHTYDMHRQALCH